MGIYSPQERPIIAVHQPSRVESNFNLEIGKQRALSIFLASCLDFPPSVLIRLLLSHSLLRHESFSSNIFFLSSLSSPFGAPNSKRIQSHAHFPGFISELFPSQKFSRALFRRILPFAGESKIPNTSGFI